MMYILERTYQDVVATWRAVDTSTRDKLAATLAPYRTRFAYNSGKIENPAITYHDTQDIFEDGHVVSFTGDPRTLFEIQNLKECHELLLDALATDAEFDEGLVLVIHRTLTQGTYDEVRWAAGERPGTYKVGDYVVGARDVGTAAGEVASELRALIDEVNGARGSDPLTVAAYFHAVFENIHPFADGNGRCGRELMNYLLVRGGHPPIIVFEEDRFAYFGSLEAWDLERDLDPLRTFLKAEAVRTWHIYSHTQPRQIP